MYLVSVTQCSQRHVVLVRFIMHFIMRFIGLNLTGTLGCQLSISLLDHYACYAALCRHNWAFQMTYGCAHVSTHCDPIHAIVP